jgi:hypothetical protein
MDGSTDTPLTSCIMCVDCVDAMSCLTQNHTHTHTHTHTHARGSCKRWRALADYLNKHMAKRQQLLAAIVDGM